MKTSPHSIPIIDFSAILSKLGDPNMVEDQGVAKTIQQIDHVCRDVGFFYVTGHNISGKLMKEVRSVSRQFFELPSEEKTNIKLSTTTGYRGYQEIGQNITKGIPDKHEAIDYYQEIEPGMYGEMGRPMEGFNLWPSKPANFKDIMGQYIELCTGLCRAILQGIALALGGTPYEFEHRIAADPFWVTRVLGYPGVAGGNDIGCGEHTDYGLLTLLNQDTDVTALEVKSSKGEWVSAPPTEGTFVCNIGDMLEIASNGLYKSTLHRVVNKTARYRVSIAYFYEPKFDCAVQPLAICINKSGGTIEVEDAVYGTHLINKVKNNFLYL